MASIHKVDTGDGPRWRVRWRNRGDPTLRSATVHTHAAAQKIKLAAETHHDLGRPYLGPEAEAAALAARRVDLRKAARDYIAARRRAGKSEGTIYQTDIALTLFFDTLEPDPEAPIPGEALTTKALAAYYDHLRQVRGCSLLTAHDRIRYVERWWAWLGQQDEWADRMPRPRRIEIAQPPEPPEPVAPTWEEMDRAIACASGWYTRLLTLCRYTGLRGEDQALQVRREDLLEDGRLRIRPELGKTRAEARGRVVPVSRHLLALVADWPEDPDGYLVHIPPNSGRHQGPPKRRAWNDQTSGAWMRAGVRREVWDTRETTDGTRKNGRPMHAFRRGFISNLRAAGADLDDVKYLVGHKLSGGVTDRYTDPTMVRRLAETIALVPPPSLVEVRAIRGGAVVWVGHPDAERYRRPG